MSQDWYEAPKVKSANFAWLKFIWAAICAGVGAGIIISVFIILTDYIVPKPNRILGSFLSEIYASLMVLIFGGAFGFLFGAPIALITGPISLYITQNVKTEIQYYLRLGLGVIFGILAVYLFNIVTDAKPELILPPEMYLTGSLSGLFGAIIFLWLIPNKETKS